MKALSYINMDSRAIFNLRKEKAETIVKIAIFIQLYRMNT